MVLRKPNQSIMTDHRETRENVDTKTCPKCGAELILFYPNIPAFTGWYCTNNCGHVESATEAEIEAELESRAESEEDL